jgi:hypothetical protein
MQKAPAKAEIGLTEARKALRAKRYYRYIRLLFAFFLPLHDRMI